MKTYFVPVTDTITISYEVEVICDSAEEAQEIALTLVQDGKAVALSEACETEAHQPRVLDWGQTA